MIHFWACPPAGGPGFHFFLPRTCWLKCILYICPPSRGFKLNTELFRLLNFTIKIEGFSAKICETILGCLRTAFSPFEFPELGGKALRYFWVKFKKRCHALVWLVHIYDRKNKIKYFFPKCMRTFTQWNPLPINLY